jgi:hypothetical protein
MVQDGQDVRITLRLPKALTDKMQALANGDERSPQSTMNAAATYLLRLGIAEWESRYGQLELRDEPEPVERAA